MSTSKKRVLEGVVQVVGKTERYLIPRFSGVTGSTPRMMYFEDPSPAAGNLSRALPAPPKMPSNVIWIRGAARLRRAPLPIISESHLKMECDVGERTELGRIRN